MRHEDAEEQITMAWESVARAFTDHSGPEVIAALLAEYVLGLSIAGRHDEAVTWTPIAQVYATLATAHSTDVLQMVMSDIRDNGLPGR